MSNPLGAPDSYPTNVFLDLAEKYLENPCYETFYNIITETPLHRHAWCVLRASKTLRRSLPCRYCPCIVKNKDFDMCIFEPGFIPIYIGNINFCMTSSQKKYDEYHNTIFLAVAKLVMLMEADRD